MPSPALVTLILDGAQPGGASPLPALTSGYAEFTPNAQLSAPAYQGAGWVPPGPVQAQFRSTGAPSVELLPTDDTNVSPSGWQWKVTFYGVPGNPVSFNFLLPLGNGATQYLSAIAQVPAVTPGQQYVPLPVGAPAAGDVLLATGAGFSTAWGSPSGSGYPASPVVSGTPSAGNVLTATDATHASWQAPASGGGTVTSVSVATANGFSGTVANPTTTPAISVKAGTLTGILKAASGSISAAAAGTDYVTPTGSGAGLTGITVGQVSGAAPLASPALTGTPTAPTAAALTDSTQVATTAYADNAVAVETSRAETAEALLAPLASPALTGSPTAPTPSGATGIANKGYVDSALQGLQVKPTATVAATSALPAGNYSNGSSGVGATFTVTATGTTTVDGHVLAAGDLVLLTAQASAFQNGLYTVTTAGTTGVSTVLTRHVDMDQSAEFPGAFVPVGNVGAASANSLWLANPSGTVTVGTTAIPFTQVNGATDLIAGSGISISGNTVSVASSGVSAGSYTNSSVTVGADGRLTSASSGTAPVTGVTAADASVVIGGTGTAPTVRTGTLDVIAAQHPAAADWSNNSHKITSVANGSGAQDAAAYGQIPAGGSTVTIGQGGTGQVTAAAAFAALSPMTTLGDITYENSTPAPARLAGTTSATKQFLTQTGTGSVSAAPAWGTIAAGDVPTLNQNTSGSSGSCSGNAATATNLAGGATFPAYVAPTVTTLTDGSSVALNAALGNDFRWTLGGSSHTLAAPSNPVNGMSITVAIKYSGSFTPLFNSVFDFGSGGQPAWTATSGKTDYAGWRYDSALNGGSGSWAFQGSILGLTS